MTVVVNGVGKTYGDHVALDDVSFVLQSGAVTTLVGANGSGRSATPVVPVPAAGPGVVVAAILLGAVVLALAGAAHRRLSRFDA